MAGHGDDGSTVATSWEQALKEHADVTFAIGVKMGRARCSFDECPAQVVIDIAVGVAENGVSAAGEDAGHETGIAGQVGRWPRS